MKEERISQESQVGGIELKFSLINESFQENFNVKGFHYNDQRDCNQQERLHN